MPLYTFRFDLGEPYFITQYSRPEAVLVRYEDYNALVKQATEGHLSPSFLNILKACPVE